MIKLAHYAGRPKVALPWHNDARIYILDPPSLAMIDSFWLAEIDTILVSGFLEATPMLFDGAPVYRRWTVVCTVDYTAGIWDAWVRGGFDHDEALNSMGYSVIGAPQKQ